MNKAILWLKDDLRIEDSRAFTLAIREGIAAVVFVDAPGQGAVPKTARRLAFETATLNRIAATLRPIGITCRRLAGRPEDVLPAICAELGAAKVIANTQIGDAVSYRSDRVVARALRATGIQFVETANDGVRRGSGHKPRGFIDLEADIPRKRSAQTHPFTTLMAFLHRLPNANYRRDMWLPGPDADATSRLSVHFACGALSTERALYEIALLEQATTNAWKLNSYRQFAARLYWRRAFIQDFEDNFSAFPTGPTREVRPRDNDHLAAWLEGRTGVPMVDAAMLDLKINGWINFRLRQLVASFALDLLYLDIFVVGHALGSLFDDYEPGIHWSQIALQGGMVPGRGPRIINPVKQGRDLDPSEAWVRSRLPYLANVPAGAAYDPWRYDETRFKPIVDPVEAARTARARYLPQASTRETAALLV